MLIHYEASVPGVRHKLQGRGNREHCCVRIAEPPRMFNAAGDGDSDGGGSAADMAPRQAIVAAVAGGMPSMILSAEGARLASEAAVVAAAETYRRGELVPGDASALEGVFEHALRAVADTAVDQPAADIASFACTLCLVVWDGARVWYGNAGDSGAVAMNPMGDPFALTHMHCGPLSGQPFPLHDSYHWEFGYGGGAESVLVATGGMLGQFADWTPGSCGAPKAYDRELIGLLTNRNIDVDDLPAMNVAAAKYLNELPATRVDGDKTVVALLNSERTLLADLIGSMVKDVTADRLAAAGASFADEDDDRKVVLPWNDELRMRAGDVANDVGGDFTVELEYQLMCGMSLDRAFELAAAAARGRAERYRVFEDCVVDGSEDCGAAILSDDEVSFDEMGWERNVAALH